MISSSNLRRIRDELGATGLVSFGLLVGAALFLVLVLRPLEARNEQLDGQLARSVRHGLLSDPGLARASTPAVKLAAFYHFFETGETATASLARLHALGKAAGVELRSADYRLHKTGTRIERYEIALPVTGSYAQIRSFLQSALVEIPVLSLDQVNFRRPHAKDSQVHAEVRLTLHLVKP